MRLKFAMDLTWVRHKIVGGTEFFVNNLIKGFIDTKLDFELVLITAKDNSKLFRSYTSDERIILVSAPINSASVAKRIIWQNLRLSKFILKQGVDLCLEPVYAKPFFGSKKVKFISVIHDLEALHFPENHSNISNIWLRLSWKNSTKTSKHIISISDFVRLDILEKYNIEEEKVTTIFDPIDIDISDQCDFSFIQEKFGVSKESYYYTVSKLNPHKNLTTLVKTFGEIKKRGIKQLPCKLVISGVNGGMANKLVEIAKEYSLHDEVVLTGFVDNSIRNALYANAKAFLFPSIFEGFGMPPIEAICAGTPVVTTKMACIPEITQNIANYVNDPYSTDDWIESMLNIQNKNHLFDHDIYVPRYIAEQYLAILKRVDEEYKND